MRHGFTGARETRQCMHGLFVFVDENSLVFEV